LARTECSYFRCVHINGNNLVSKVSHRRCMNSAEIAAANDRDAHGVI
jgi:hypothetical protein